MVLIYIPINVFWTYCHKIYIHFFFKRPTKNTFRGARNTKFVTSQAQTSVKRIKRENFNCYSKSLEHHRYTLGYKTSNI